MKMNLPNRLTVARVILVPVFVACLMIETQPFQIAAAALFVAASLTDLLDGYIARKRNLVTDFGKFMDPIADKLLVMTALVGLVAQGRLMYLIAMVSIAREFVISGVRMVAASKGVVIAAGSLGKYKTQTQMVGVTMCILATGVAVFSWMLIPAQVLLWASVALSVWSCADYIVRSKGVFSDGM